MVISNDIQAIVLAAGSSSRFKTGTSKLFTPICGQKLLLFPLKALANLTIPSTIVAQKNYTDLELEIKEAQLPLINFAVQTEPKGTGDALLSSKNHWNKDYILVINGDMPLITSEIIHQLYARHVKTDSAVTFATAHFAEPGGYGRVIKSTSGIEIVESRDFQGDTTVDCCINAGIYLFKKSFLERAIEKLIEHANSQEFYITDLIKIASDSSLIVETIQVPFDTVRGVNTVKELWACEQIKRAELITYWMNQGVRFPMADKVKIEIDVQIGAGTVIDCGVQLLGGTRIEKNCIIEPYATLQNAYIGRNVHIKSHSIIKNSRVEAHAQVGPFAHVHSQSVIEEKSVIGNFVEVVRSTVGPESKAKHLTYLGDTHIGAKTNIGAGTITCNYNGVNKEKTTIGSNVFVGSNTSLVAPVIIENNAIIAAGSTITQNVPTDALAISRAQQVNKENYAPKLKKKYASQKSDHKKNNQSEQSTL